MRVMLLERSPLDTSRRGSAKLRGGQTDPDTEAELHE
jgi:hypothetical protein